MTGGHLISLLKQPASLVQKGEAGKNRVISGQGEGADGDGGGAGVSEDSRALGDGRSRRNDIVDEKYVFSAETGTCPRYKNAPYVLLPLLPGAERRLDFVLSSLEKQSRKRNTREF